MLVHLTKFRRVRTGRLLALIYLLCVLTPAAALALGSPAPWIPSEIDAVAITRADQSLVATHHLHGTGSLDDSEKRADSEHTEHHHHGKAPPGPCCAMLCLSAMLAHLPAVLTPFQRASLVVSADFCPLAGEAPSLLYRPPIV